MIMKCIPSTKYEIIHETISSDDNELNITWLCEIAGVSRTGYYKWLNAEQSRKSREYSDDKDFALILAAYKHRGFDKGERGIHMRLLHQNPPVVMNRKKIQRLMNKFNLHCPIRRANPYRKMAKALQTSKIAPNLLNREFRAHGPRTILLTDITYIPRYSMGEDGFKFSYLSVIMDAYTKQILAYVLSKTLDVDFVLETVQILITKHGSELKTVAFIHSDQGCHYTSHKFVEIIANSALRQSMSRRGNCWDNAPQESLFGHMKDEAHILYSDYHTDIVRKIDDWVDYYNKDRYQWNLEKLSPDEYYDYVATGIYPLLLSSTEENSDDRGGSAPEPPEFNALVSGKADEKKDD